MLTSDPLSLQTGNPIDCISCGQICKREQQQHLPDRLFGDLRLTLLSTWSKVEPNRVRDYSTYISPGACDSPASAAAAAAGPGPGPAPACCTQPYPSFPSMATVSTPLPKSIDFTQFESPYSEVVENHGFVSYTKASIAEFQQRFCLNQQLTQSIAPKPSLSEEYDACMDQYHYYDCDSDDECYYEKSFREMEVGEKRCFSFEIQYNIMDAAYFISDFSKLERTEKMGRADPVKHNEIWEAERIVKHVKKTKEGKTLFLVEWSGRQSNGKPWPKTWEPAENLGPVLLHLYERQTGLKFTKDE